ncbi:efflux RND transporter periplasmic adaptor subunit [Nocardioides conyzicola]|uniref:Efflux RND transporter periplasmic adaptor subunit n=1 Tax=Nocardioides conyzicola TaxID=1651781 RepID=A0ABP8Y4R3_9ACTN
MRISLRGRRRAWLAVPVALVVAAGSGVWLMTRDSTAAESSTTATVSTQTIEQTVSADGTIAARKSSDESFAVSGTVTKVLVDEGDKVKKGDPLARVDDSALVASRAAALTSLEAATTQLDEDEDNGESDVQLAADNAAVVSAQATLADAREAVQDATLRASIAGTVTSVDLAKGDVTGSSSSSSPSGADASNGSTDTGTDTATGTISIVSTHSFVVDGTVAAADAQQLKEGLQAKITATGVDDTIYGTVSEVGLVAQTNDSGAAVFPVTVEVTGKQQDLYAGVSATVSIVVKQVPDVLTVATNALSTTDGKTYVTKLVDGKEVKTEVETGETYGMATEITQGLKEGDTIVVQGFRAPTGGGNGGGQQQGELPGGGQLPDFSQLPGGMPAGGPGQ